MPNISIRTTHTRAVVLAFAAASLLSGCAATTAPAPAAPPAGPVIIGSGTIDGAVALTTTGPATFSVRTVTVPPGGSTGWHRHPGTEMSIVKSGAVTVLREGACDPVVYQQGAGVFIPDGTPHLARNDGTVPAEIVVTYLLTPGSPDRADAPPPCPAS